MIDNYLASFCSQYSLLLCIYYLTGMFWFFLQLDLIKVIASQRPVIAAASIVQRINVVFGDANQVTKSPQDLDAMEGAQLGLEAVVSAIFDGSADYGKTDLEMKSQLHKIFEGILQQLLSLKWTEPNLAVIHGHYLDALGPFLRHYPDAVASVVNKLFELLTSLPITFQVHLSFYFSKHHSTLIPCEAASQGTDILHLIQFHELCCCCCCCESCAC